MHEKLRRYMEKSSYGKLGDSINYSPFYHPALVAEITAGGQEALDDLMRPRIDSSTWTGRQPRGGLADTLAPLRRWWARCPACEGAKRERIWSSQVLGDILIPCGACDGKGSWTAYERRRLADIWWDR